MIAESKNLHEYLATLPGDILDNLYNHPATCLAVFRLMHAQLLFYIWGGRSFYTGALEAIQVEFLKNSFVAGQNLHFLAPR